MPTVLWAGAEMTHKLDHQVLWRWIGPSGHEGWCHQTSIIPNPSFLIPCSQSRLLVRTWLFDAASFRKKMNWPEEASIGSPWQNTLFYNNFKMVFWIYALVPWQLVWNDDKVEFLNQESWVSWLPLVAPDFSFLSSRLRKTRERELESAIKIRVDCYLKWEK